MSTLVLNAGLGGATGNSHVIAQHALEVLRRLEVRHEHLTLAHAPPGVARAALARAERLVFISGTYWGGFSSLLQQLFEELTPTEGSDLWLGKPASALVSAHQVGAQSVLFRLQGVLTTFGCCIPPMSGVIVSKVGEALRARAPELCADVWGLEDVATALYNLQAAPYLPAKYRAWPVDREHFAERWLEPVPGRDDDTAS